MLAKFGFPKQEDLAFDVCVVAPFRVTDESLIVFAQQAAKSSAKLLLDKLGQPDVCILLVADAISEAKLSSVVRAPCVRIAFYSECCRMVGAS